MARIATAFLVTALLLSAIPSTGLCKDKVKSKLYDFGAMIIDGELKSPTALYTDVRPDASLSRTLRLRQSYVPVILETGKAPCFKPFETR